MAGGDFLGSGEKSEQLVGDKFPLLATRTTRRNHGVVPEEYLLIIVSIIHAIIWKLYNLLISISTKS